jgi:hypothetical protein
MYGNKHTNKPIHPIVQDVCAGKKDKSRLIPNGDGQARGFQVANLAILRAGENATFSSAQSKPEA